jgi:hypothetical protein
MKRLSHLPLDRTLFSSFRIWMRRFRDLVMETPCTLFMFSQWCSKSLSSPLIRYIVRISWPQYWFPKYILCSVTAGCSRWWSWMVFFGSGRNGAPGFSKTNLATLARDVVYVWRFHTQVTLDWPEENATFPDGYCAVFQLCMDSTLLLQMSLVQQRTKWPPTSDSVPVGLRAEEIYYFTRTVLTFFLKGTYSPSRTFGLP